MMWINLWILFATGKTGERVENNADHAGIMVFAWQQKEAC